MKAFNHRQPVLISTCRFTDVTMDRLFDTTISCSKQILSFFSAAAALISLSSFFLKRTFGTTWCNLSVKSVLPRPVNKPPISHYGLPSSSTSVVNLFQKDALLEKSHYLPDAHCFADDTQLYLSFKPLGDTAQADAIQAMEKCIDAVRNWMIQDRLLINDDKTEFLLVGTRQQLEKLDSCSITVGNNRISPSPCVKNLGSWFDSNLSMTDHINKACNAAFYHLHNLRRIKKYLSRDSLITFSWFTLLLPAVLTTVMVYCLAY